MCVCVCVYVYGYKHRYIVIDIYIQMFGLTRVEVVVWCMVYLLRVNPTATDLLGVAQRDARLGQIRREAPQTG